MPNGKVDRAALPEPKEDELETPYVAPRTELEKLLVNIWQEVLDAERIGIKDNFFELGGHSLKATQVVSRIENQLQVKVDLIEIFQDPTIEGLAATIEKLQPLPA